ncbi:MAG: T9SS type A sorting domain-containing protein, partial [Flavitalea sp.]
NHYPPSLVNGPLTIPANTTRTFEERFTLPAFLKATVLTVAPHMHLIAESIKVFANKPGGDTIRLISIPHWDFHWQGQYYFQKPVIVDGGSTIRAFATYNNTTSNPHNPNNPPQTVNLGEATTDEMMLVYFAFTQYQSGDENIIIDSSLLTTPTVDPSLPIKKLTLFPNPVQQFMQFTHPEPHSESMLVAWDMTGRKILEQDVSHLAFVSIPINRWPNGVYRVYLKTRQSIYTGSVVVQH